MVKAKIKHKCEYCGKVLKNARALVGHMWFAHTKRAGEKASLKEDIALLEREKGINPDTVDKINDMHDLITTHQEILKEIVEALYKLIEFLDEQRKTIKQNPGQSNPDQNTDEEEEELPDLITPILNLFKSADDDDSPFL